MATKKITKQDLQENWAPILEEQYLEQQRAKQLWFEFDAPVLGAF